MIQNSFIDMESMFKLFEEDEEVTFLCVLTLCVAMTSF